MILSNKEFYKLKLHHIVLSSLSSPQVIKCICIYVISNAFYCCMLFTVLNFKIDYEYQNMCILFNLVYQLLFISGCWYVITDLQNMPMIDHAIRANTLEILNNIYMDDIKYNGINNMQLLRTKVYQYLQKSICIVVISITLLVASLLQYCIYTTITNKTIDILPNLSISTLQRTSFNIFISSCSKENQRTYDIHGNGIEHYRLLATASFTGCMVTFGYILFIINIYKTDNTKQDTISKYDSMYKNLEYNIMGNIVDNNINFLSKDIKNSISSNYVSYLITDITEFTIYISMIFFLCIFAIFDIIEASITMVQLLDLLLLFPSIVLQIILGIYMIISYQEFDIIQGLIDSYEIRMEYMVEPLEVFDDQIVSIDISNISGTYDEEFPLFTTNNLRIDNNNIYLLTSPSGSGKTSLLYSILGCYTPYFTGSIKLINNEGNSKSNIRTLNMMNRVSYVSQFINEDNDSSLFRRFQEINPDIKYYQISDLLHKVGLQSILIPGGRFASYDVLAEVLNRSFSHKILSGGELKRLYLAIAMSNPDKDILILDEILDALDSQTYNKMLTWIYGVVNGKVGAISSFHTASKIAIVVSHNTGNCKVKGLREISPNEFGIWSIK